MSISKLCEMCKAGVHVEVNGHKDLYMPVESYLADEADLPKGMKYCVLEELDINSEIYDKMVESDTVVKIQFYPHTPIGSYTVYGFDVDDVIVKCIEILEE